MLGGPLMMASVIGLSLDALVHVGAAAAGLPALLLISATAFTIVKLLGAGYLIYSGLSTLFSKGPPAQLDIPALSSAVCISVSGSMRP